MREVVRVHRELGRLDDRPPVRGLDAHLVDPVGALVLRLETLERPRADLCGEAARGEGEAVDPARVVGELLADERIGPGRRRVDGDVPADAAGGGQDRGDRRRLPPDQQRGRARTACAQDLRREIGRAERQRHPERDRARVARERAADVGGALLAIGAVVVQQADLESLRDQVLRKAECDPVVRRRDPEDVGALRSVDEARAAVVGDADRDVVAVGELPGRVDPCAVGDDRDRAGVERAAGVLDGLPRREVVVGELHRDAVGVRADDDPATGVQVVRRQGDAVADGLGHVRAAGDGDVDGDDDLAAACARTLAAPGREQADAG